ncbi:hypothetical protein ACIQUB_18005 [Rhizobium sp. NPDC090275]|uniref:hypothetical protein n=1 Tax=Rhizobium sp. NPDC090275 TaxID=3364498 RepID=UPI00383BC95A
MAFTVALNRDRKRLAEAMIRDMPIDNPLRQRYVDWINELDRILKTDKTKYQLDEQAHRPPLTTKDEVQSKSSKGLASDAMSCPASAKSIPGPSPRHRPRAFISGRTDTREASDAGSVAGCKREQLLRENRMLRYMLNRYL